MIDKRIVQANLNTAFMGRKLFVFDEIDSTNICARILAEAGTEEGSAVVADFQTAGRGRLGRQWHSERGENLLFSVILRPRLSIANAGILPFYAAVSIANAITKVTGLPVDCKWPNDLLCDGRKVCGILLENGIGTVEEVEYAILGIGINVNQQNFSDDLLHASTSLALARGRTVSREDLLKACFQELELTYRDVKSTAAKSILHEWTKRCSMLGKNVTLKTPSGVLTGSAVGLAPDGGLMLECEGVSKTYYAGDVTIMKT